MDNPIPVIAKRLWIYGNVETIEKEVADAARKYNTDGVMLIDPDKFGGQPIGKDKGKMIEPALA